MALFNLTEVIDSNKIRTSGWKWKDDEDEYTGNMVKILGYEITDTELYKEYGKNRLRSLLEGKSFELKNVKNIENDPTSNEFVISCSVILDGIDISTYFRDLAI